MTFSDFIKEYEELKSTNHTYRSGQHFINRFIIDSSSEEMQKLWDAKCTQEVMVRIYKVIRGYNWDWNDLPEIPLPYSSFLTETGDFKL